VGPSHGGLARGTQHGAGSHGGLAQGQIEAASGEGTARRQGQFKLLPPYTEMDPLQRNSAESIKQMA
jgi:hypothetical protein